MERLVCSLLLAFFAMLGSSSVLLAENVRLPVARDLWISSASGEEEGNNGATTRLKIKGYQEFSILDFDVSALADKRVKKAVLHLKTVGDERLYRVGVSSITADWIEGSGTSYSKEEGASSFRWRINNNEPWRRSGVDLMENDVAEYSDITSVIFGQGGSFWSQADASEPEDGWQTVEIDPDLVYARILWLSYGFVVFDDTGTELERDGDDVNIRLFPNRFFYSKEQNASSAPFLEVEYESVDKESIPNAPEELVASSVLLPYGDVKLSWRHSSLIADETIGFEVKIDGQNVPRSLIPTPVLGVSPFNRTDDKSFNVRLSGVDPTKTHSLEVASINRQGVKSKPALLNFKSSDRVYDDWKTITSSDKNGKVTIRNAEKLETSAPVLDSVAVSIVDEFVKFTEKGEIFPKVQEDYLLSNALWNAKSRQITLTSAKNEFIGFQIVFSGNKSLNPKVSVKWNNNDSADPQVAFYRLVQVNSPDGKVVDPMIPLDVKNSVPVQKGTDVVYCEIFVPADVKSGVKQGTLRLSDGAGASLELSIKLKVWNFSLPNELSFLPEMNCYSLPDNERDYYRLAQVHRTYVNRVPYSHRGNVGDGLAPIWDENMRVFDWSSWERRYGAYFDGSAFADLPRGAVPIEAFYLPLFENFPANIFEGFNGVNTWPDEDAFSKEYRDVLSEGYRQFAQEISDKKWNDTLFLFFLNNKMDYKRNGWSKASSPWLLDEPASYRDFAALEFYGTLLKKTLEDNKFENMIHFRADISRPQWERNSLDSVLDVYVVGGGPFRDYRRMVLERANSQGRLLYTYGTTSAPHESAFQPILWSLDSWSAGADGIVPWQTIGNADSWKNSDELALFYPPTKECPEVVPSIRLKSYRRGEQDVEYLTLALKLSSYSREELSKALRARLDLDRSKSVVNYAEDAGTSVYNVATPDELQFCRRELGEWLSRLLDNKEKESE